MLVICGDCWFLVFPSWCSKGTMGQQFYVKNSFFIVTNKYKKENTRKEGSFSKVFIRFRHTAVDVYYVHSQRNRKKNFHPKSRKEKISNSFSGWLRDPSLNGYIAGVYGILLGQNVTWPRIKKNHNRNLFFILSKISRLPWDFLSGIVLVLLHEQIEIFNDYTLTGASELVLLFIFMGFLCDLVFCVWNVLIHLWYVRALTTQS